MATNYTTPVSEKELDNLLAQAFLNLDFNEPQNEKMMEIIATQYLAGNTSLAGLMKRIFLNVFVVLFIVTTIAGALIVRYVTGTETEIIQQHIETSAEPIEGTYVLEFKTPTTRRVAITPSVGKVETGPGQVAEMQVNRNPIDAQNPTYGHNHPGAPESIMFSPADSNYRFPQLTEEEIKTNNKQKKKMIAALVKMNKEKYAYIPKGSMDYKGKTVSVESFYMQATEVSNLEYRTFLHDLLVQGRKQDYLLALPDSRMWTERFPYYSNQPLVEHYFWHPAYDDYPVVNISHEAAKLYCTWLAEETNAVLRENDKLSIGIRLPNEYEWAHAAMGGKTRVRYANAGTFLRDSRGCYEVNYMGYTLEECRYDSIQRVYLPLTDKHSYFEDGGFYTVKTTSYVANPYGLFCMAGNVSEMITDANNNPATKGGSWFSCDHFLQVEAEDEHRGETGASPMIGFRPVVIGFPLKTN